MRTCPEYVPNFLRVSARCACFRCSSASPVGRGAYALVASSAQALPWTAATAPAASTTGASVWPRVDGARRWTNDEAGRMVGSGKVGDSTTRARHVGSNARSTTRLGTCVRHSRPAADVATQDHAGGVLLGRNLDGPVPIVRGGIRALVEARTPKPPG